MYSSFLRLFAVVVLAIGLAACGGSETQPESTTTTTTTAEAEPQPSAAATGAPTVTIQPVDNEMKYATTEFTVEAGQEVTIVFENTATSPAMQHNVVVLTSNDDEVVNRVGQAALQAGEAVGYIPEDDAILAHTPMSKPGETVEVTFTAPSEPGDYRYICTFPGHYVLMQGVMHVTASGA